MKAINDINYIKSEYDFTDSVVTSIYWENNLLDLVLEIDYFWYKETVDTKDELIKKIKLKFINCQRVDFNMPQVMKEINPKEYSQYTWSWFNIVNLTIEGTEKNVIVEVKTVDESPKWLYVNCQNILIEI